MNCFSCFTSQKSKKNINGEENESGAQEQVASRAPDEGKQGNNVNIEAQSFSFRELATATKNFRQECLLGEGGFGRVYKGTIPATGKVVAVKQLDRSGMQGSKEFLTEIGVLSQVKHENLVNLVGYCADGDQRLLVYEYMSGGSVERRLFEAGKAPMDWFTRMKIALGAAKGVEYLHDKANPPVVYRDLKSSNILLDDHLNPKLSDFGLAKLSGGDKSNLITPGVTGTYGYSAPEYIRTGQLTLKSDVYGFGVVMLELIAGRRAIDTTRPNEEQNLVSWAQPLFRNPKRFPEMADPVLNNNFPEKDLNQAVAIAAMCLQEEEGARPLMSDVVTALSFLSVVPPEVIPAAVSPATGPPEEGGSSESEEDDYSSEECSESDERGEECKEYYSKSSRKSSKKSLSLLHKSSKKSSSSSRKELKQKSSSRKASISRRSSATSEEASGGSSRISLSYSQGDISFGLISSGSGDSTVHSTEGMPRLPHAHTTKQPPKHDNHRRDALAAASAKV